MKALEMLKLCIGKTVQAVHVQGQAEVSGLPRIYEGFSIAFTDGYSLDVQEAGAEGEIEIELIPAFNRS